MSVEARDPEEWSMQKFAATSADKHQHGLQPTLARCPHALERTLSGAWPESRANKARARSGSGVGGGRRRQAITLRAASGTCA